MALGAVAAPSGRPSDGGALRLAMVWPVPDRSPEFDPGSVTEVLADYGEAHAVSATAAQLGRLRAQHFLVDPLGAAKGHAGHATLSSRGSGPAYYAVSFVAPPTPGWLARLEQAGGHLSELPALDGTTLVTRLTGPQADRLAAESFVASIAPYEPEKVHPGLRGLAPGATVNVSILLFDPAAASGVAALVESVGGQVFTRGDAVEPSLVLLAQVAAGRVGDVAAHPEVRAVEESLEPELDNNVAAGVIGVDLVQTVAGLTGTNQIVAVADTGLDTGSTSTIHSDFAGRIKAHFGYGRPYPPGPDPTQIYTWSDPHGHGTHVMGSVLGDGTRSSGAVLGMAPDARLVVQSLLDDFGGLGGLNAGTTTILSDAYNQGARIQSNSWGSRTGCTGSCPYSVRAAAYDSYLFSHPDLLVLFAAGNSGLDGDGDGIVDAGSLGDPAIAKNVLTVGASENDRASVSACTWACLGYGSPFSSDALADDPGGLAAFSSRGPTTDGRVKPDVVAPGTFVLSTKSSLAPDENFAWGVYNPYYAYDGGTSMATPIVAGSAALLRQEFILRGDASPSAALLKAALIHHADDLAPGQYGTGSTQELGGAPDFSQGWGRVDVASAIDPPLKTTFDDHKSGLLTGQAVESTFSVSRTDEPFTATLAWTDRAGASGCEACLVNDLDLVLIGPTGIVYRGNQFTSAIGDATLSRASEPDPLGPDTVNNVERIQLAPGMPSGTYRLRVQATSVPVGSQPFALLTSSGTSVSDLAVTLQSSVTPPRVTAPFNLVLTATNNGPDDALDATVTYTVPTGMTPGTAVPSQGSCDLDGAVLTCEMGGIADDASATVTVPLTPTAKTSAVHRASIALTDGGKDPVSTNNARALSQTVASASVNLATVVTDSPDPLLAGKPLTYRVNVTNLGPDDAPGVKLADTLPSAAAPGTPVPSQGSCSRVGTAVTCLLGALASGESATVDLPVTPTMAGTIANTATATVTGLAVDPATANNKDSESTAVQAPRTDLVVTNVDSADPLFAGDPLTYTVTVTNGGPDDAPAATLTDVLPTLLSFTSASTDHGSCTRSSSTLLCALGPLASGEAATVTIDGTPKAAGTLTNVASVLAAGGALDPATANNRVSQPTAAVAPRSDLAVANVDSADPVVAGVPYTYTVTVANNGPDDAPAVKLVDTLPAGMTYGAPVPSQGSCTRASTTLTCLLGRIADGASATASIQLTPKVAGTFTSTATATVTNGGLDPATANNRDAETTRITTPSVDLAVTLADDPDPVALGSWLNYTATVTNGGPDGTLGTTLRITLPGSTAFGTPATTHGTCVRSSTTLTCSLGPLADSATATVTMPVKPSLRGVANTSATIAIAGGLDPDATDNKATQATTVT